MTKYIIDTNVWIAASGKALCSVECEEACLELLSSLREFGVVLILDQAVLGQVHLENLCFRS